MKNTKKQTQNRALSLLRKDRNILPEGFGILSKIANAKYWGFNPDRFGVLQYISDSKTQTRKTKQPIVI